MVSIGPEGHHGYPSRDARPLASGRLSLLLALEVSLPWRAPAGHCRDGSIRCADHRLRHALCPPHCQAGSETACLDQRYTTSNGGLDCTPVNRGISLERGAALPRPRSGSSLWHHRYTPIARHGYSGQTHRTGLALAERLCRTANRIDSARVSRSFRGLGRSTSAPDSAILHSLLQQHQNAPIIGQRCARLSSRSADRINKFIPGPWWASSPLSAGFKFSVQTASINSSSLARLMCVESCKCRARSAVDPQASPARRIRSAALLEILGIDRSFASRRTATASDDQGAGTECARSSGRNRGPVFAEIF